jgi:hypothetical protein
VRTAILSLLVAAALAATAGSAAAAPPRFSSAHSYPIRATPLFDEARYGEFRSHSDPNSAFATYGVAYPNPYYRNAPPVNYPQPTFSRSGGYIGTNTGGIRGSLFRR